MGMITPPAMTPVMMQPLPMVAPPAMQARPLPIQALLPQSQQKSQVSTSAATKTGAVVMGGMAAIRLALAGPILYSTTKSMALSGMTSPAVINKFRNIAPIAFLVGGAVGVGFMTGVGALVGKAVAHTYNHFVRKENAKPNYLA